MKATTDLFNKKQVIVHLDGSSISMDDWFLLSSEEAWKLGWELINRANELNLQKLQEIMP